MKDEELKAIDARAAAATKGPWEIAREELDEECSDEEQEGAHPGAIGPIRSWEHALSGFTDEHVTQIEADACFIAAARTDVPALCADVRERDATIARLEAAIREALAHDAAGEALACARVLRKAVTP